MEQLTVDYMPPEIDFDLFDFGQVSEEELGLLFDDLSRQAVEQPDDQLVQQVLVRLVVEAKRSGYVDYAMQMAVSIGAMACLHAHLEQVSAAVNDAGSESEHSVLSADEHKRQHEESHGDDEPDCMSCSPRAKCRKHQK